MKITLKSNLFVGGSIKKLTKTINGGRSGLKTAITTVLLIIMGTVYCLYSSGRISALSSITYTQQGMYNKNI